MNVYIQWVCGVYYTIAPDQDHKRQVDRHKLKEYLFGSMVVSPFYDE
ncbi:hypothetical protein ACFSUR_27840 [Halalkalibacter alkalisediminis]